MKIILHYSFQLLSNYKYLLYRVAITEHRQCSRNFEFLFIDL
jgi:hypothetical protein